MFGQAAIFACALFGPPLQNPQRPLFEQDVASSNPLRAEQAAELDGYIRAMAADAGRLRALYRLDYSSPGAYVASTRPLRRAFAASIGYPPPGAANLSGADFRPIGEDDLGTYYRAMIPVLPGVHAEGVYIVPKVRHGRVPLIISMHGGGGSPEVALFHGGSNYHGMVREGVRRGYAVFAPQHLFSAPGYPADIRNQTDDRLRLIGTSLTAVEIAKITRSLDVLLRRPEIDPRRVGMVGLSYGGYYALVTAALDPRIRVAVSSCYFGVQEFRYAQNELSIPSDFRFADRFSLFRDPEVAALICPRSLMIQAGKHDDAAHRDMGIRLSPQVAEVYRRVGLPDAFAFDLFDGGHEFDDSTAWPFIARWL